jgi:hypothetical protein
MSIVRQLFESDINFVICSRGERGFRVYLGDEKNGYRANKDCRTWADVELWLDTQVRIHFPNSDFARGPSEVERSNVVGGFLADDRPARHPQR